MLFDSVRKLYQIVEPQRRRPLIGLLCLMLLVAVLEAISIASVFPFIAGLLDPEFVSSKPWLLAFRERLGFASARDFSIFLALAFGALVVLNIAMKALTQFLTLHFAARQNAHWTLRAMRQQLTQPYAWFLQQRSPELGRLLLQQVQEVVNHSLVGALQLIVHGAVAIGIVAVLVVLVPIQALLATLLLALLYGGLFALFRKRLNRLGLEKQAVDAARFAVVHDAFAGIKELQVHHLQASYLQQLRAPMHRWASIQTAQHLYSMLPRHVLEGLGFLALTALSVGLLVQESDAATAVSTLSLFGFAAYRLLPALQNVYQGLVALRLNVPVLSNVHAVLTALAMPDPVLLPPMPLREQLELDQISFCYHAAERPAVDQLSLRVQAGESIALVGASGAGKSTVADILLGLLVPQSGAIRVDGTLLDAHNRGRWQSAIGYVPQQIYLTDDTVAANIAFGVAANERKPEQIRAAAQMAALHGFITDELPGGYDACIGERGVRLSGGQRQRIGIARALYRDPSLLILDEATSALDNRTESAVMDALEQLRGRKTLIVIAHRLSTVQRCDRVCYMAAGKLVAAGSYQQLIAECEAFRQLVNSGSLEDGTNVSEAPKSMRQ